MRLVEEYCAVPECRCPLDEKPLDGKKLIYKDRVCSVCFDLFVAVYSRKWFRVAHARYERDQARIRRLLPGAEYLD